MDTRPIFFDSKGIPHIKRIEDESESDDKDKHDQDDVKEYS